jgi:esterase/lipase
MKESREELLDGAPQEKKDELLPTSAFATWSAAEIATDREGAKQNPPVVHTPNGVFADILESQAAGKVLWEPSGVAASTFVIVGQWDGITPITQAQAVFGKLVNAHRRHLVQIEEGTHLLLLEKNRMQLYREVQTFLDN